MYIIRKGSVKVFGTEIVLQEGAFFGEMALMLHLRRNASVLAESMCDLCVLHKNDFDGILVDNPSFADKMKEMVVSRQVQQLNVTDKAHQLTLTKELQQMCEEQLNLKRRASVQAMSSFHSNAEASTSEIHGNGTRSRAASTASITGAYSNSIGLPTEPLKAPVQRKKSFVIRGGRVQLVETVASFEIPKANKSPKPLAPRSLKGPEAQQMPKQNNVRRGAEGRGCWCCLDCGSGCAA
jgi:hypothetical protein